MRHQHVVTWPGVIFDLRRTSNIPGQPLTYRRTRCADCDWTAMTRTYAEAVDLCADHELFPARAVQGAAAA